MIKKNTYCRICEPACPIQASIDDNGKVVELAPAPKTATYKGLACHKGLSFLDIHNDPNRLNVPLKRQNPRTEREGKFEAIEWDQAFVEIGEKLRGLREQYGPNAVAFYVGNPNSFDSRSSPAVYSMMAQSGSQMQFNASTQDVTNKGRIVNDLYGSAALMIPDLEHTEYFLLLGSNPKVSRWTIFSHPNDSVQSLKAIKARGGKVCFVNPRKTESSTDETGPTLFIKPGADVYFLAAILHEIRQGNGIDEALVSKYGKNVEALFDFAAQYPAARAAKVTGLDPAEIVQVAEDILAANAAAVYTSTGINQSRQGILCVWLAEMINFVTGNLGRKGGMYSGAELVSSKAPSGEDPAPVATSVGNYLPPKGPMCMPGALLADLIHNGEIKALISISGNPLLSIGGEEHMRAAFEKLDLMVCLDIVRNETVEMADYALAGSSWVEREDLNILSLGMQPNPAVLRYSEALEPLSGERRSDWWVISRLAQEMGIPSLLDDPETSQNGFAGINQSLQQAGLSIDHLKEQPMNAVNLEITPYDSLFERCLQHPDKKIDCMPAVLSEWGLLDRCDTIFAELDAESTEQLKLISLRTTHMHNSWHANTNKFRRGGQAENPLHMCSEDAERLDLFNGDAVRVFNDHGDIETVLRINDELRSGAVAMSHGYGHNSAYGLAIASDKPGVNCNRLMPTSIDSVEPLSNMSWLNGVPVNVVRA